MPSLEEQIKFVEARYKPELDDLQRRAQQLADDFDEPSDVEGAIGVKVEFEWEDKDIIFDVPSVTMKTKTVSFDLPEVRSDRKTIIFHTPSIRMEDRVVGRYPEWHGPFKVVWKDIIVSVPVTFMEEQRIIFDIPVITMTRQEIKLDLPEFRMEQVRWVLRIPRLKTVNVRAEADKLKEAGERLKAEGEALAERMKVDINAIIAGGTSTGTAGIAATTTSAAAAYDEAIAKLKIAIDELIAKGIDPIKVPTESGEINLRKQLADLVESRARAMGELSQPTA